MKNKLLIGLFGVALLFTVAFASGNGEVHMAMNKADFVAASDQENP